LTNCCGESPPRAPESPPPPPPPASAPPSEPPLEELLPELEEEPLLDELLPELDEPPEELLLDPEELDEPDELPDPDEPSVPASIVGDPPEEVSPQAVAPREAQITPHPRKYRVFTRRGKRRADCTEPSTFASFTQRQKR
jgi:hypothetical protein